MRVLVSPLSPKDPAAVFIVAANVVVSLNSFGEKGPIILYDVAMLAT